MPDLRIIMALLVGIGVATSGVAGCTFDAADLDSARCDEEGASDGPNRRCESGRWVQIVAPSDATDDSDEDVPADPCDACDKGQLCCGEGEARGCVTADERNCGACGATCGDSEVCVDGSCTCPSGLVSCDGDAAGACDVALLSNPEHCGACNRECDPQEVCDGGGCLCDGSLCADAEACCLLDAGIGCVDTGARSDHCGDCGNRCRPGELCQAGDCFCPGAAGPCGADERCCAAGCFPAGEDCPCGGVFCTGEDLCCADTCVPNDATNCGACGTTCRADQTCVANTCVCAAGTTDCDGACVDILGDPRHCGGCDVACGAGSACCNGACASVGIALGSVVGDGVAVGTTAEATNDYGGSCGKSDKSPDVAYSWTAPEAGCWYFDTSAAEYDTVLHIRDLCTGTELACNDDVVFASVRQSQVWLALDVGDSVLVVVDGFNGRNGEFRLDVNPSSASFCD